MHECMRIFSWIFGFVVLWHANCAQAVPSFEQVRSAWSASHTLILSREGEVLQRLRTDFDSRRGQWVALGEVSHALLVALLGSEDRRFAQHAGVDWQAVGAAAWSRWGSGEHERGGASTITMQLVGLLDADLKPHGHAQRSWRQKIAQAHAALALEQTWTKAQILEAYLNLVPLRGELVGVDAAARTLFGRAPHGLDAPQAAILAALVRAPNARAAVVTRRACALLQRLPELRAQDMRINAEGLALPQSHTSGLRFALMQPPSLPQHQLHTAKLTRDASHGLAAAFQAVQRAQQPAGHLEAALPTWKPSRLDCSALAWHTEQALSARRWAANEGIAPHWARRVWAQAQSALQANTAIEPAGLPISHLRTTVSAPVQRAAQRSVQRHLSELAAQHVQDAAVVVLDNATGQVLAWVGSSGGTFSRAAEFDAVLAPRQVGSTLKPFVYAQAIAQRRLTAASLVQDSAAHIDTGSGLYVPQNYDRSFRGWVSVRQALAASLNVPTVRALWMVGPDAFAQQLVALDLSLPHAADHYGLSLALGSPELSLLQLTNAYRTLARGGWHTNVAPFVTQVQMACPLQQRTATPVHAEDALTTFAEHSLTLTACDQRWTLPASTHHPQPSHGHQAVDAAAAFIVRHILADASARAPTFGLRSVLNLPFESAVKTGTSKDMRDNWAIGFSQRHTVGVWVGNADGSAMHAVSGASGAAPIWAEVMTFLHEHYRATAAAHRAFTSSTAWNTPDAAIAPALVEQAVRFVWEGNATTHCAAPEPPRTEWFLRGTEQAVLSVRTDHPIVGCDFSNTSTLSSVDASTRSPRIVSPVEGTILALDPDISPAHQRLSLRAAPALAGLRWQLVSAERPSTAALVLGEGAQLSWLPLPGRHKLQLIDTASGRVLDERALQVRGAGLKPEHALHHLR